jgi:hypothetical protein
MILVAKNMKSLIIVITRNQEVCESSPGRNNKVTRGNLFLKRPYSREGDNGLNTDVLQRSDVGLSRDLGRCMLVKFSVSSEESDSDTGRQFRNLDRR